MYYNFIEKKSYVVDGVAHKIYDVESYNDEEKTDFVGVTSLVAAGDQVDSPAIIMTEANKDSTSANNPNYIVQRKQSYPSIEEQLDMQYHDALNGTTTWKDSIAKVKSDIPKE
jgi:hypothetical protein